MIATTMEVIIKIDVSEPDELEALLRWMKSIDMVLALDEIRSYIVKIWDEEETIDVEILKTRFFDILADKGINIDELVS